MGVSINKEHKDRLFVFLFGKEQNKAWTLELYNAVNGTDYKNSDDIEINTIEDVLYMGMKNDVSFLLNSFLSLYEHQSTYNPNMPIRNLMYLGKLYDKYIKQNKLNIYGSNTIRLPIPKCVTFYNGEEYHEDQELHLADAFDKADRDKSDVEVTVRMININSGCNKNMIMACRPLYEYSWLIGEIRKNKKIMGIEEAVDKALEDMPEDFVILEYIRMNRAEVKDMCLTEYNEAETMKMIRDEAKEEGKAEEKSTILKAIDEGATLEDIKRMLS